MTQWRSRLYTSCIAGLVFFGLYVLIPSLFVCLLLTLAGYMLLVEWRQLHQGWWTVYPVSACLALVSHVVTWRDSDPWYGLYPFLAAWLVDSGGYFVGSWCGAHPCWPTISKHKTWEGVAGGIGFLLGAHVLWWLAGYTRYSLFFMVLSALVVASAAIIGDAVMSLFKRRAGLKDTGSLLPGHGGLLDRMDSVLLVVLLVSLFDQLLLGIR